MHPHDIQVVNLFSVIEIFKTGSNFRDLSNLNKRHFKQDFVVVNLIVETCKLTLK